MLNLKFHDMQPFISKHLFLVIGLMMIMLFYSTPGSAQAPAFAWAKTYGNLVTNGDSYLAGMATDKNNNNRFYISTVARGNTLIDTTVLSNGCLVALDSNGRTSWVKQTSGGKIATDASGNIYIASAFKGTITIGATTWVADSIDFLLMKYDASGNLLWTRKSSGNYAENPTKIRVSDNGTIYVAGSFSGNATIANTALNTAHRTEVFLAAYDANGNSIWAKQLAGNNSTGASDPDMAVTGNNIYITASFLGNVLVGTNTLNSIDSCNIFLAKYSSTGLCEWVRAVQNGYLNSPKVVADTDGNAYLAGNFTWNISIGSTNFANSDGGQSHLDIFLAKYDANGDVGWAKKVGDGAYFNDFIDHIDISPDGIIYFAGSVSAPQTTFAPITYTIPNGANTQLYARYDPVTGNCLSVQNVISESVSTSAFSPNGRMYIAGNFYGSIYLDNDNTASLLTGGYAEPGFAQACNFIGSYTSLMNYKWGLRIGGLPASNETVMSIATDQSNNIISAGVYGHALVVDDDTLFSLKLDSCAFLSKRNAAGQPIWTTKLGKENNSGFNYVITDPAGNIYTTGYFSGTEQVGNTTISSAGRFDVLVAKYNASGVNLWAKSMGGTDVDYGVKMALDPSGNIILTGLFRGTTQIGTATFTAAGIADIFVTKLDANGNNTWQLAFGGTGWDNAYAITTDASGNIFLSGRFSNTVSFGSTTLTASGISDAFLVKIDPSGNVLWAKKFGITGYTQGSALANDGSGGIYLAGFYRGNADFGCTTLFGSTDSPKGFLAHYSSTGICQWIDSLDSDESSITDMSLSPSGKIFVTGTFYHYLNIGSTHLTGVGYGTVFMACYDPSGNFIWARQTSSDNDDVSAVNTINANVEGNVYIGGIFGDVLAFENQQAHLLLEPGNASSLITSVNSYDGFLAAYTVGVVPLQLLNFDAVKKGSVSKLSWTSSNQTNFSHFEIQRSVDGRHFQFLKRVDKQDNLVNDYNTIDSMPFKGWNYYRLKMIDNDGSFFYSKIEKLFFADKTQLSFYPNPAKQFIIIDGAGNISSVKIFDMSGRVVRKIDNARDGFINLQGLLPGTYILQYLDDLQKIHNHHFIKE